MRETRRARQLAAAARFTFRRMTEHEYYDDDDDRGGTDGEDAALEERNDVIPQRHFTHWLSVRCGIHVSPALADDIFQVNFIPVK